MGRRKDPPAVQAAKGFPGRRTKAVIAQAKADAARPSAEDELLASMDVAGLRPPSRFARKEFKEERDVWMAVAPRLKQTLRASAEFQAPLVAYCDAVARYNRSVLELRRKGYTVEQQMIGFLTFALRPYLTRIEQAVRKQLLSPAQRGRIFAEFNLEGLMRADSQGRAAIYSTFAQNGIATRNEMRKRENWPAMDGGDKLTVQSNLVPLDQLGTVPPRAVQPAPGEPV